MYINILAYYYTFVSEFGVSDNHFICIDSFGFWTTNVKNYTINCHKPGITAFADQHTVSLRPFVSLVRTTLRYDENKKIGYKISETSNILNIVIYVFDFRAKYRQDLSMFVVKNLCYIFLLSHSLYPGMIRMFKECDRKRSKVKDFAKRKLIPNEVNSVIIYSILT